MRVRHCYLSAKSDCKLGDVDVATRLRAAGYSHLWGERITDHIDTIVIHYISAASTVTRNQEVFSVERIVSIMCDLGVSSHYLLDRMGTVTQLVPEEKKAWHCGGSIMPPPDNRRGVNDFSIGVELVATHDSGFTNAQYEALEQLVCDIVTRYGYRFTFTGHEDVASSVALKLGLRDTIKHDPGPCFSWDRIAYAFEGHVLLRLENGEAST